MLVRVLPLLAPLTVSAVRSMREPTALRVDAAPAWKRHRRARAVAQFTSLKSAARAATRATIAGGERVTISRLRDLEASDATTFEEGRRGLLAPASCALMEGSRREARRQARKKTHWESE